jgi:hypothetical protein
LPVHITPAIKHIKCHAGLDPASSSILDSRFRGNDGFDIYCCRSNNIRNILFDGFHREVRQIYPLILLNASFLPPVSSFIISNNQNHRTLIWNVVKTLQQVTMFFNIRRSRRALESAVDKFCRSFISAEKKFFYSDKIMGEKNERLCIPWPKGCPH